MNMQSLQHIIQGLQGLQVEMHLSGLFVLIILLDLFFAKQKQWLVPLATVVGLLWIGALESQSYTFHLRSTAQPILNGMLFPDRLGLWMKILFTGAALLTVAFDRISYRKQIEGIGEFYALLIATHLGLNLMVISSNLLVAWLAVEVVSISSYVLVAYRFNAQAAEASLKYILYGALSSAMAVYGISWLYGITGTLNFTDPHFISGLAFAHLGVLTLAFLLILASLLFKISAVPFHWWAADVYQAAPSAAVAFLSTAPKAAGLVLLIKIFLPAVLLNSLLIEARWLFFVVAVATMFIGNISALRQRNLKRMLAFSAIAHSGFLLMLVTAINDLSVQALAFYMLSYVLMNFAAFFVADILEEMFGDADIQHVSGLSSKQAYLSLLITFLMLALAGLPPAVGFFAKFQVFSVLWNEFYLTESQVFVYLLLIGVLNTVIALFYYLRLPYFMYFKKWEKGELLTSTSLWALIFVTLLSTPLLIVFIHPSLFFMLVEKLKLYV